MSETGEARRARAALVRDAMVPGPPVLEAVESAQEAGRLLSRPEVRAVLVCDGGRLVGVLSRSAVQRRLAEDAPPAGDDESLGV